jgi:hypothetical protein
MNGGSVRCYKTPFLDLDWTYCTFYKIRKTNFFRSHPFTLFAACQQHKPQVTAEKYQHTRESIKAEHRER